MSSELKDRIPEFGKKRQPVEGGQGLVSNWSALTSAVGGVNWLEVLMIIGVAVLFLGGGELALRIFKVPSYVLPTPSAIFRTLFTDFSSLYLPHLLVTLQELVTGFVIGATVGLVMAAVITQAPTVEKIITPYVLILVTTPMMALVPLLMLKLGFGTTPRIIAVALAAFPMVMINSSTGFRRTDLAKVALARSYGADTLQIFLKIRFPMAMPMIIVGLMVGSIFGLLTAVGAEMVGGKDGLGNRIVYFSSLVQMDKMFAAIFLVALVGISLYLVFYAMTKKWASWEA